MKLNNQKGVSLVELLAAVTISAFLIGLISTVIYQSSRGFNTITARESSQEKARLITETIVNEIRKKPYNLSQSNSREIKLTSKAAVGDYVLFKFVKPDFSMETSTNGIISSQMLSQEVDNTVMSLTNSQSQKLNIKITMRGNNTTYETTQLVPFWNN